MINGMLIKMKGNQDMPRRNNPISVKVKDNKVTFTFNAEGWDPVYSKLIEFLGRNDVGPNITIAQYVADAFESKGRKNSPQNGSFDRMMGMLRTDVAYEEMEASKSNNKDTFTDLRQG